MDPHILIHVNVDSPGGRYPNQKLVSEKTLDSYEYTQLAYATMHCIILL